MTEQIKTPFISEDWTVVILGIFIIALAVLGWVLPTPSFGWKSWDELWVKPLSSSNLTALFLQFGLTYFIVLLAAFITRKSVVQIAKVFPIVFILASIALVLAGNAAVKSLNLEAVIFSLSIGLLISNVWMLPSWIRDSLNSELYVKIGLILLGTSIIFGDLLKAGFLGLLQALLVVLSVWYFAYWICKKLKLDEDLSLMISSAVSICGVSAAIATAGAIKGDNKKLSYVISLVLVTAIPMMIFMPLLARQMGLSEEVTGAWLGGTIDTTGAVVASGSLVGETALKISTIVKFSQNVLLGIAAFAISVYWSYSKKNVEADEKPTLQVIWNRFPKFVLGFIGVSLFFSFAIKPEQVAVLKDGFKSIQSLWFVLAFTSIGLETRFSDIFNPEMKKPMFAFLTAQGFNILVTLGISVLLFG